jgi:hypothetical protein
MKHTRKQSALLLTMTAALALALALTACTDQPDTGGAHTEPWTLTVTGEFKETSTETTKPYSVTFIDQTNGDARLKDPAMATKINQTFAIFSEKAKTDGMIGAYANIVLPRGVKINIVNSGESFEDFQALGYNTVRCHVEFLSSIQDVNLLSAHFENVLFALANIHARARQTNAHAPC